MFMPVLHTATQDAAETSDDEEPEAELCGNKALPAEKDSVRAVGVVQTTTKRRRVMLQDLKQGLSAAFSRGQCFDDFSTC